MNKYCKTCVVHFSLMLVNTLMKSYCIVLPHKCIGQQISPKSSSNTKLLTSKCFPRHYRHIRGSTCITFTFSWNCRLYSFLPILERSVSFFSYLAKISYYKRFSASHKLFGSDSTNDRLRHSSTLLKNKTKTLAFINSVSWEKKTLYLFNHQFFIYLQTVNKLRCSKLHPALHSREAGGITRFDWKLSQWHYKVLWRWRHLLIQDQWYVAVIFLIWAWVAEMIWKI